MANNDEGHGSGDCDDVYRAADEFFSLTDDQQMLLLGPPVASGTETDTQTGGETETGIEIQTGIKTGAASGSGAGVEPKAKRQRFLTNSGLLVWWSRRWTTAILSQRRPRKRVDATAIK